MSKNNSSDTERLKAILEAYGTNKDNWPATENNQLNTARAQSSSLDKLYNHEKSLDDFLANNTPALSAPSHLLGAIMQDAENLTDQRNDNFGHLFRSFFKASPGLILAACLGVYLGIASPNLLLSTYDVNLDELSVSDTVLDWEFDNGNF